jgi:hypothetical protein
MGKGILDGGGPLRSHEIKEEDEERHKGQNEKNGASMMMNPGINHLGTNMDAKLADREDPESVPQNRQGKHRKSQRASSPVRSQEKMAGKKAGDNQGEGGMDPTAFRGNPESNVSKLECQIAVKNGHARDCEHSKGAHCRIVLELRLDPHSETRRKGRHQDQKSHWERY